MRLVVDTGVFSAALSRRRRAEFDRQVNLLAGNQVFLAASTVAELRYGALFAEWGEPRRSRLEQAIETTTVIPVSDALLTTLAELRFACRRLGHPSEMLLQPSCGDLVRVDRRRTEARTLTAEPLIEEVGEPRAARRNDRSVEDRLL